MATQVYLVPLKAERKRKKWGMRWMDAGGKWHQQSCRTLTEAGEGQALFVSGLSRPEAPTRRVRD